MKNEQVSLLKSDQSGIRYNSLVQLNLITLNIALSSFYFGYTLVYLGTIPIDDVDTIFNSPFQSSDLSSGFLNGAVAIGGLIGALVSALFIAHFSRKHCILIVNGLAFAVGCLIFIKNYYFLAIMRVCQGICVGLYSSFANLMIKELSPKELSGTFGTYTQLSLEIGLVFGCLFRVILQQIFTDSKNYWQFLFGFTLITILTQSIILLTVFPYETPKYLLMSGKIKEAEQLLKVIYKEQFVANVLEELKEDLIKIETLEIEERNSPQPNANNSSFTTIIAIHLAIMQQLSGVNTIVVYGSEIARKIFPSEKDALPILINLVQVLATLFSGCLLANHGRKLILQGGCFFSAIACAFIAIGFFILPNTNDLQVPEGPAPVIIITGLFLFMLVFGISLGPIVWLYIPEIVQPKVVPYSTAANWLFTFIIMCFFPILKGIMPNQNPAPLFLFFTAWTFASFLFNQKYVVETKDRSEGEISQKYQEIMKS